jgi:hypothetical protein
MNRTVLCFTIQVVLAAWVGEPVAAHESGAAQAGVPSLDITRSGERLHLLLGETATAKSVPVLNHLCSEDNGQTWSSAVRVDTDNKPAAGLHRGMDAQIAATGDHLIAVWQTSGTDPWGGGPMTTALSSDAGKTWKCGPNPADDGSTEGHNFIDITADGKGVFHLVWLDTRKGKRGLRATTSTDYGQSWAINQTVDEETCECCWNTLTPSPDGGAWVLYRDREPRDMSVAFLSSGEKPQQPISAGRFQWEFPGCPHVGGGLSVTPAGELQALVWSGKDKQTGVYRLHSKDQGHRWSEPQRVGDDKASNPDITSHANGASALVWNTVIEERKVVFATTVNDQSAGRAPQSLSSREVNATHPRIIATRAGFRAFWTEETRTGWTWQSTALRGP